jgi:hypothetical protein
MKCCAPAWSYPQRPLTLMVLGGVALASVQATYADGEIVGAPIDLSAFVHEALLPGATLFDNTPTVTGALHHTKAEREQFAPRGQVRESLRNRGLIPLMLRTPAAVEPDAGLHIAKSEAL